MKDFFFGKVRSQRNELSSIELNNLNDVAERVSSEFFTAQVNRLLQANNGELVINDDTSSPEFEMLVGKLVASDIGFIDIESRTGINNTVKATLSCSLYLLHGVIHVRPHWCAYKEMRADEIISSLLVPLHLNGLIDKTCLRWSDSEVSPLLQEGDFQEEVRQVFSLAKYSYNQCDDVNKKMDKYVSNLTLASEINAKGLIGQEAVNAYSAQLQD